MEWIIFHYLVVSFIMFEYAAQAQDCGNLADPQNGQVSLPEGTTYGAIATYTCNPGYAISTVSDTTHNITCTANGTWSELVTCSIKDHLLGESCPDPSTTNLPPKQLCSEGDASCRQRNNTSQDYTCQCNSAFYDDNGNDPAGRCVYRSKLAVKNITFSSITTGSIRISWVPPADKTSFISGHRVLWRHKQLYARFYNGQVTTNTFYDVTNDVVSGNAYRFIVQSINTVDYTDSNMIASASREQALKPETPGPLITEISNFEAANKYINLAWTASNGTVQYYVVSLFNVGSQDNPLATASTSTPSANLTYSQMKNGYRYDVTIIAVSEQYDGEKTLRSETRREQIKTVVKVPSAPSVVDCVMVTENSVTIKWQAPSTPNGDLVQYKVDTYSYNNGTLLKSENTGDLDTEFVVGGLQPNSYFYFNVSAINELHTSAASRLAEEYCQTKNASLHVDENDTTASTGVIVAAVVIPIIVLIVIVLVVFMIYKRRSTNCVGQNGKTSQRPKENYQKNTESNITAKPQFYDLTNEMTDKEASEWLKAHGFEKCKTLLKGFTGMDMLKLSKKDLTQICGVADGIRIYNRLKDSTSINEIIDGSVDKASMYMELDDTKRDGIPYENIEMDRSHLYSALQQV